MSITKRWCSGCAKETGSRRDCKHDHQDPCYDGRRADDIDHGDGRRIEGVSEVVDGEDIASLGPACAFGLEDDICGEGDDGVVSQRQHAGRGKGEGRAVRQAIRRRDGGQIP